MAETSGSENGGNSPSQIASLSGSQGGSDSHPLAGGSSVSQVSSGTGFQANGNSGSQASGNSGPQAGRSSGSQAGSPSASQSGERSRSQVGGASSTSSNASSGKGAQVTANGPGRGDVDVQNWRGTASKDGESYPVRLNVESILTFDPGVARGLLSSNLSLEDIRYQLGSGSRDTILRGSLRISNDTYRLVNVTIESSNNTSTLSAVLAGQSSISGSGDQAEIAGHISLAISADDLDIARGYAIIDDTSYSGTYTIELERQSGRGYMWCMPGGES